MLIRQHHFHRLGQELLGQESTRYFFKYRCIFFTFLILLIFLYRGELYQTVHSEEKSKNENHLIERTGTEVVPIVLFDNSKTHSVQILLDLTPFHDLYEIYQFMLVCQNCKQNSISGRSQPRCYCIWAHIKWSVTIWASQKDSSP